MSTMQQAGAATHHATDDATGSAGLERVLGGSAIDVQRTPTGATVRVSGALTAAGRAQLGDMLEAMIASGAPRLQVHLAMADQIDLALLQLLRAAHTRLGGALVVTADRPELGTPLAMIGLSRPVTMPAMGRR